MPAATPWVTPVDSNDLLLLGLLLLAAVSIGAVVYLLVNPYFSGERRTDKRIQGVTESRSNRVAAKAQADAVQNRRRQVTETLKELEDRQKAREKVSMRLRLQRAGLEISPRSFWICSLAVRRHRGREHLAVGAEPADHRAPARAFRRRARPAALDPRPHRRNAARPSSSTSSPTPST